MKIEGRVVDAGDVYVGGRSGPDPKLATKLLEDVPCDALAGVLEGIVPYHSREKMHRPRPVRKVSSISKAPSANIDTVSLPLH